MIRKQDIPRASRSATPRRTGRKPSVLDRLGAGEAQAVLFDLLAAHPDLRVEAERLALSFVGDFDFDMKRQLELKLNAAALEMGKGIVLGLYRVRRQARDGVLGWAPDFPKEAALQAVRALAVLESPKGTRSAAGPRLAMAFVDEHAPEWSEVIARCQERR